MQKKSLKKFTLLYDSNIMYKIATAKLLVKNVFFYVYLHSTPKSMQQIQHNKEISQLTPSSVLYYNYSINILIK